MRTKKYSTDTLFTHPFFFHANHCEIMFWYGCRAEVFGKSWFGSARLIVYTTNFIRAGLVFLVHVPILPVLGLPFEQVQARVKFWFGTDEIRYGKVIYTAKFIRAEPFFFGTRTIFIRAVPKFFCSVNGPLVSPYHSCVCIIN